MSEPSLHWLFEYKELGGHTHVKVRCGPMRHSRGLAGTLVLRNEEFASFRSMLGLPDDHDLLEYPEQECTTEFEEMADEVARVSQERHPVP